MNNKNLLVEDILAHDPCREGLKYARKFGSIAEAWEACDRGDWMVWLLQERGLMDKRTSVSLAIKFAERVLHIYEVRRPGDSAPRNAVAAAQAWLDDPSEDNQIKAHASAAASDYTAHAPAASAAASAAAADYTSYAYVVYAAYAAASAYAAAYTSASAYAADAAAYTAAAADERKEQARIIREIVGNPFQ